jgi:hypothetical protein
VTAAAPQDPSGLAVHFARLGDVKLDLPAEVFEAALSHLGTGRHRVAPTPDRADVILFTQCHMLGTDWPLAAIRESPLCRRYPERVYVYDERDDPWCAFPGVYVSMPRKLWRADRQRAWGYQSITDRRGEIEPDLLFSLMASPTHACRKPLFRLSHPDAIIRRVDNFTHWERASQDWEQRRIDFRTTMDRSRFVLCPRGAGTSSYRLYETMAAGRVPIIIADDWVAPHGVDWDSFSIRWPQYRTAGLIDTLTATLPRWPEMAAAARAAYEQHFAGAPSTEAILDLIEVLHRNHAGRSLRLPLDPGYLTAGSHVISAMATVKARQSVTALIGRSR